MLVSLNWLKDYVDIDVTPSELAESMTLAGLAVEAIAEPGKDITKVYTGKILTIAKHPNADKLVICQIDMGEEENIQIITGATNVQSGQVVPVAVAGAHLAGGQTIKKSKLRGEASSGMLCSGEELGINPDLLPQEQKEGIMILPSDTPLGLDVKQLLGLDDIIFELELTPNRGDCLSMLGVATEVAALLEKPLRLPEIKLPVIDPAPEDKVQIDLDDFDLCPRYVARLMKNVKVGPSPDWMQQRLRAAGVRPISNVVDVTNYVMLETGQPMHAFDYHQLKEGHIIVRRAYEGETIISLDKTTRTLSSEMLIITDLNGPVAIAGVMGGLNTEVTENTTSVLLESAYFKPVSIRHTSHDLALRSESSSRFEKGIDLSGCLRAADRAAQLLVQINAAQAVNLVVDNYPAPATEKTLRLRTSRVNQILATELRTEEIASLLTRLNISVQQENEELLVQIPSYRPDITIEVDLIEEVARMYGYNQIKYTMPSGMLTQGARNKNQAIELRIKNFLSRGGFKEVITYSFISPKTFDRLELTTENPLRNVIKVQNPLSEEQSIMRTLLFPGLLDVLQRNSNRQIKDGAIYEIGRVYYPRSTESLPDEVPMLAAAVTGSLTGSWNIPAAPMDFYFLKGCLEMLLNYLGVPKVSFKPDSEIAGLHPGRTATILAKGEPIGYIGELHPSVQENYALTQRVILLEIDLRKLLDSLEDTKTYQPLPKFPGADRDLAVVVKKDIPADKIIEQIYNAGGSILRQVQLFDVYQSTQFAPDKQSMAFTLHFQSWERTLTDEELAIATENIFNALQSNLDAELR